MGHAPVPPPTTPPFLTAESARAAIDRAAKGDASALPIVRRPVHNPELLAD